MRNRIRSTAVAMFAGAGLIATMAACATVASADVGECIVSSELGSEITEIPTVDCSEPHDAQVVGKFDVDSDGDFPGNDAIREEAFDGCLAAFEDFVGVALEDSQSLDVQYIGPSSQSWDQANDREILCIAYTLDGSTVTESWEGSGA